MSIFHDVTYATRLNSRLPGFKSKGNNTFNFRCPLCGDSQKSTRKARGYLFPGTKQHGNSLFFKCYNCNESMPFEKFLARVDAALCQEYKMGRYTNPLANTIITTDSEEPKKASPNALKDKWDFGSIFTKIENLPKEHYAYRYLVQRQIPRDIVKSELYFTPDFRHALEEMATHMDLSLSDNTISKMRINDARIIIPFTDLKGNIIGFQGRALDPNNTVRYITIKLDPYAPKVYGLSRLDTTKENIYVFEGPFDSMFIPNSVAVMDSDLTNVSALLPDVPREKFVLVFDNEPRNDAIVSNMRKAIKNKFRIVIFTPNPGVEYEKNKDINDVVVKGKITPSEVHNTLDTLTYSTRSAGEAMIAEIHFNQWKKVS
jgi:hypothetical protein